MPVARNTMESVRLVIGRGLSAAISGFFAAPGLPRRRSSARSQGQLGQCHNIRELSVPASGRAYGILGSWRTGSTSPPTSTTGDNPSRFDSKVIPRHFDP